MQSQIGVYIQWLVASGASIASSLKKLYEHSASQISLNSDMQSRIGRYTVASSFSFAAVTGTEFKTIIYS